MTLRNTQPLRLGTRGSLLARAQSQMIANELQSLFPPLTVELIIIKTTGDVVQDKPLHDIGGKGLFVKELEIALLENKIDFAVHSLKDVPVTMPLVPGDDLIIAAVPARADARDALISTHYKSILELPANARIGTGSLRRKSQLLALRNDLQVEPLRGNLDTRLRKLREGEFDAIVLAMAGLQRAGLFDSATMFPIHPDEMLPAAGQGALALQARKDDVRTIGLLAKLDDTITRTCIASERAIILALDGDCHSPIAAHAQISGGTIQLRAAVAAAGGGLPLISASSSGAVELAQSVVAAAVDQLNRQDARTLLGTD